MSKNSWEEIGEMCDFICNFVTNSSIMKEETAQS